MKIAEPSVNLTQMIDNPLQVIEEAGRTCYRSENRITETSASKFVRMLIRVGHESVLEHAWATAHFVVDRGITHEIVRHRLASYCQESTRYCNYSSGKFDGGIKLIPMLDGLTEQQIRRRKDLYRHCEDVYLEEVRNGVKPQQARDNLPTCLGSKIVMTANFREWRHFFRLRTHQHAHPVIRELAITLLLRMHALVPAAFDDLVCDVQHLAKEAIGVTGRCANDHDF